MRKYYFSLKFIRFYRNNFDFIKKIYKFAPYFCHSVMNSVNLIGEARSKRGRWKGSLSDFVEKWEEYKRSKDEDLFMYSKETGSKGVVCKYSQRPYFKDEFARKIGYTRYRVMKEILSKRGSGYADLFDMIDDECDERIDFLALTGAINPMYAARIRNLSDKQEVKHEGEVTTRTTERQCSAEEAQAHFLDWSSKI